MTAEYRSGGAPVRFAVEKGLFGVIFQPIMFAGRDRSITPEARHLRRYTLSHLAHDLAAQVAWDWQPLRDWFPMSAFSAFGYLSDRLRGDEKSMVCTAAPSSAVGSPLVVNVKTGVVRPLASFFDIEGFLGDLRPTIDQDLDRFGLMAAVHRAIDSRFDSVSAPAGYTSANLDQLHAQSMARVNSSIDGWTERAYESGDWRLLFVLRMWFQDLFNIDLQSVRSSTTVVATEEGEISFCTYNSTGWREAVERMHRTATLAEWHRQHGRHEIFAGGKLVPIDGLAGVFSQVSGNEFWLTQTVANSPQHHWWGRPANEEVWAGRKGDGNGSRVPGKHGDGAGAPAKQSHTSPLGGLAYANAAVCYLQTPFAYANVL